MPWILLVGVPGILANKKNIIKLEVFCLVSVSSALREIVDPVICTKILVTMLKKIMLFTNYRPELWGIDVATGGLAMVAFVKGSKNQWGNMMEVSGE